MFKGNQKDIVEGETIMATYGFNSELKKSQDFVINKKIASKLQIYLNDRGYKIVSWKPGTEAEDRAGCDLWLVTSDGRRIAVDLKIRSKDYGKEDVALENVSVGDEFMQNIKACGWVLNTDKITDLVCWYWKDTDELFAVGFQLLVLAFKSNYQTWKTNYGERINSTTSRGHKYYSKFICVPKAEVKRAIAAL